MERIDLHCHSTSSDGTHPPHELIEMALEAGVKLLALTDHDTMAGVPALLEAAEGTGLQIVRGLELSADYDGPGTMHILVYGADPENERLTLLLETMKQGRRERGPRIIEKLAACGVDLDYEDVLAEAGGAEVGRAHIATAMVAKGLVGSPDEAFRHYLRWGQPAYEGRTKWSPADCISAAGGAGGIAVLAHPCHMENSFLKRALKEGLAEEQAAERAAAELDELVGELAALGLRGLEAYYSRQGVEQTQRYVDMARRHGLIATGGSDFHGEKVKPGIRLGYGAGPHFHVPAEVAENLLAAIEQAQRARAATIPQ